MFGSKRDASFVETVVAPTVHCNEIVRIVVERILVKMVNREAPWKNWFLAFVTRPRTRTVGALEDRMVVR
jgi:hypothetical protein